MHFIVVFDANVDENLQNNTLDYQKKITSPVNATSWSACEKLTRVRPKFVFTRVFVFCPCEQSRVEPGLDCAV